MTTEERLTGEEEDVGAEPQDLAVGEEEVRPRSEDSAAPKRDPDTGERLAELDPSCKHRANRQQEAPEADQDEGYQGLLDWVTRGRFLG